MTDTPVEQDEWGMVCHFSAKNHSSSLSTTWSKANGPAHWPTCKVQPAFVKPTILCCFTRVLRGFSRYSTNRSLPSLQKRSEKQAEAMLSANLWPGSWVVNRSSIYPNQLFFPEKETIDAKVHELLETTRNAFTLDDGQDYYITMEASLKLKEISYIQLCSRRGFPSRTIVIERTPVLASCPDPC